VSYNYQLAGNAPPQAPEWTANLGYEHHFPFFGGTLTPRVQTHLESRSYFSVYNLPLDEQTAYHRSDIDVSYASDSRAWTLSAYVRNIENKLILTNVQSPPSTFFGGYREQYAPPRTYGASVMFNW
jgi:iron complex outermembrane receptor protein